ncbi:MAG: type II toxin-antitoxin system VapC family toxin [Thaumarchaeota archaeon]|nr:type II toxin-antitoxin system VapC family toxin [Nitrososphaerota archaeon]
MIIADSSYVSEGILVDRGLLGHEQILTADLAVFETANAIWKHQVLLHEIDDGIPFLSVLFGLLRTNSVIAIKPDEQLMKVAYQLASRHNAPVYDMVFVALALGTGLELKSFDDSQMAIMKSESNR